MFAAIAFESEANVNPIKKSIPFGKHTLTLETGEIARQAGGATSTAANARLIEAVA